jgi:FkbM family methyltransferase
MSLLEPRTWIAKLMLNAPDSVRSLRNVPVLGGVIHAVSHKVVSVDQRIWVAVESGPAEGLELELNPRTGQAYARDEAETAVQNFLASKLKPGDVFYDLGANIGLFTLIGARIVSSAGRVFSFEPDPQNAIRLRRNLERNGFSNATVVETGVWSSTVELAFAMASENSPDRGVGTFMPQRNPAGSLSIRCVSLDDFAQLAEPPTAIKCDVEGAELEVLKGARQLLSQRRPWILCEMHSSENDRAARKFLAEFGYSFTEIDDMHVFAAPSLHSVR